MSVDGVKILNLLPKLVNSGLETKCRFVIVNLRLSRDHLFLKISNAKLHTNGIIVLSSTAVFHQK